MATVHDPVLLPEYRRLSEPSRASTALAFVLRLALAAAYGALVVVMPPNALPLLGVPIVIALVLVLWMLPDRAVFPQAAIERVFWPYLVAGIIWPAYIAVDLPGLPWLTPTRLLLFVLMFLFAFSVSTSGRLRAHLLAVARSTSAIWVPLLIWQFTQVITIPISGSPSTSLTRLFNNLLGLTGAFFVGCLVFSKHGRATTAVAVLIVLAVVCSIDGFIELRMGMPPWANSIPSFMRVDSELLGSILGSQARSADGIYRVRGPFPLSSVLAEFLFIALAFVLSAIIDARSTILRIVLLGIWGLIIAAILVTQSRMGLVCAMGVHFVFLPLWATRRWQRDKSSIVGPAFFVGIPVVLALFMVAVLSSTSLSQRVFGGGAQAASDQSRRIQREMAIPRVLANPLGYGLGRNGIVLGFRATNGMLTVDNHYITTVLDLGVVGLLSFYFMWLAAAWTAAKLYLRSNNAETALAGPLTAIFLAFVVDKSVLSQENNHWLLFLLLGMLSALKARELNIGDPMITGVAIDDETEKPVPDPVRPSGRSGSTGVPARA